MKTKLIRNITLSLGAILTITSCSHSSDNSNSNNEPAVDVTLTGKVIGSHYEGAKVFIDSNANLIYDENESSTISASDGSWELPNPNNSELNIIANIAVGNTVYSYNRLPLMKKVKKPLTFIASTKSINADGKIMLSAISTMIWKNMKAKGNSFEDAQVAIANEVNVPVADVLSDYDLEKSTPVSENLEFASEDEIIELEVDPISNLAQSYSRVSTADSNATCKPKSGFMSFLKKSVGAIASDAFDAAIVASSHSSVGSDEPDDIDPKEPDAKDNPDYTCQLDTMITLETNIEGNVSQINTELKVADSLLDDIYTQMVSNSEETAQVAISEFINNAGTMWLSYKGNIDTTSDTTNLSLVQNCETLKLLNATGIYDQQSPSGIFKLVSTIDALLGNGVASNGYLAAFFDAKVQLDQLKKITATQGTSGHDIVAPMNSSANDTFSVYTKLATALQQAYNLEATNVMFAYTQQNKIMCSDATVPTFTSIDGLPVNNDLVTNMGTLNNIYKKRFKALDKIIIDNAALYSDIITKALPSLATVVNVPASYSGVPGGDWNKTGALFAPMILVSADYNVTGSYNGVDLNITNFSKQTRDKNVTVYKSLTLLDVNDCLVPTTDQPSIITLNDGNETELICGWIKAESYSDWISNSYLDPQAQSKDDPLWNWSYGVDHKDDSTVEFNSAVNFITFFDNKGKLTKNGDGLSTINALDYSTNKIHKAYGLINTQTIQFISPEGEKALFDFGIFDLANEHKRIFIDCGATTGTFTNSDGNSWTCSDEGYADDIAEKIHISFPKTKKEYTIYVGAHGDHYHDDKDPQTYFDFCEAGDDNCAKNLGYYTDYKASR